jgi:chromosomal replication initiator protein
MQSGNAQLKEDDLNGLSLLWNQVAGCLKAELDDQIYSAYIEPLKLRSYSEEQNTYNLVGPSRFLCSQVENGFREKIEVLLSKLSGSASVNVSLSVDSSLREESPRSQETSSRYVVIKKMPEASPPQDPSSQPPAHSQPHFLNSRYHFDSFVVGSSNQFCHAAAMRVAERPGQSYNPLFIYGGVGLGKTHLLHAIGNAVLQEDSNKRVIYLSAEAFTNELIQALRHAKMDEFKKRFRTIDVLLIDDVQFISGKERTQEEFFHTFNALYSAKNQIVLTSDKIPSDIPGIEERLKTRFSWGLTADLQAPDFETRVAILNRKASHDGFFLPEEAAHFIASKVSSNVRELEGALTRLHAVCSLKNQKISLQSAESALQPLLQTKPINVSVDDIKKAVSNHFSIKVSEMVSKRRTRNLSFPRHVAMYLCRKHTTCSYPEIGGHFGGRDHSSVIHAAHVVSTKLPQDGNVREAIAEIERALFQQ